MVLLYASVAQLVEHHHGKVGVTGSSPVGGSGPARGTQAYSSIGRASVSKTEGCRFDSYWACSVRDLFGYGFLNIRIRSGNSGE